MRWWDRVRRIWSHEHDLGDRREAERVLRRLRRQQPEVDELERIALRELGDNNFRRRIEAAFHGRT